jgi:hypothetical protein
MQQMQQQIQAMGDALNNAHEEVKQKEMEAEQKDLALLKEQRSRVQAEMAADQAKYAQAMQPQQQAKAQGGSEPDDDEGDLLPVIGELMSQTQEDTQHALEQMAHTMMQAMESSQRQIAELIALSARPKPSEIRIERQPDGSFVGMKVEGGEESVLHINKTDSGYVANRL